VAFVDLAGDHRHRSVAVACGVLSFFKPGSLVGRRTARAIIAILIGLAQIGGWVAIFVS
jgi:hypothetical protein